MAKRHVLIGLLHGINLRGTNRLAMSELRAIVGGLGFDDVHTYIQSGNVVFGATSADTRSVARRIEDAIASSSEIQPGVVVLTLPELETIVTQNPFGERTDDPRLLHVVFYQGEPPVDLRNPESYAPEEMAVAGRVVYMCLPNGIGRSKLAAAVARDDGGSGTVRNWRTVNRVLDLARDA